MYSIRWIHELNVNWFCNLLVDKVLFSCIIALQWLCSGYLCFLMLLGFHTSGFRNALWKMVWKIEGYMLQSRTSIFSIFRFLHPPIVLFPAHLSVAVSYLTDQSFWKSGAILHNCRKVVTQKFTFTFTCILIQNFNLHAFTASYDDASVSHWMSGKPYSESTQENLEIVFCFSWKIGFFDIQLCNI